MLSDPTFIWTSWDRIYGILRNSSRYNLEKKERRGVVGGGGEGGEQSSDRS